MKSRNLLICLIIFGLAIVLITTYGCRKSLTTSIRDIYNEFRRYVDNEDYDAIAEMMTEKSKERIEKLGGGDFKTGFLAKLEKDKTFYKAITLKDSDAIDLTLSGKMNHSPYAFEKAVRIARNLANQAESLLKRVNSASGAEKSKIQAEIDAKTAEYKKQLNDAMELNGEKVTKDAVHKAMSANQDADIITLKDAIDEALKDCKISGMDNIGFLRFELVPGGDYKWDVAKVLNEDKWLINIP